MRDAIKAGKPCSVLLDESTDRSNLKQLLIYIRYVNGSAVKTEMASIEVLENGSFE